MPLRRVLRKVATYEPTLPILLGLFLGIATGYGAIACRWGIHAITHLAFGDDGDVSVLADGAPTLLVLFLPAIGGVIVAPMVYFWAKEAKGHGVPEVMDAIARKAGVVRPRVVLVKALASVVTIGTGGSVGWEGPIIQIGAGVGSTTGQLLRVAR
ncbi:MAG: chloride channel protein, partial [Planctomycetota bacterium]